MKPAKSFTAVDYNSKKQNQAGARLVHFENFGHLQEKEVISKKEFKQYLDLVSRANKRVKNKQFHAVLSAKGQEYSHEQLKDISLQLMDRIGYRNQPILIYEHHDTKNNHVHIVSTRIQPDGTKIPDNFEGVRANNHLAEIQRMDLGKFYENALNSTLSYKLSSPAQLTLLMEQMGYKYKYQGDFIHFFKHGKTQGKIAKATIREKIEREKSVSKNTKQIQAMLYKYAKEYSSELVKSEPMIWTTEQSKFSSPLSDFLKSRFGYEFVYFTSKEHEKPYGYTIIDHNAKTVYKGSEIMKLNYLESLSTNASISGKEKEIWRSTKENDKPEEWKNNLIDALSITDHIDNIIEQGLNENENTAKNDRKKRRKRKRPNNRRL